jgi:undecaprenyl diphosphate synthase
MLDKNNLPKHIAIIMDGNGRWAKKRGLPRVMGHRAGIKAVRETVTSCAELGIKVLTLYAFSKENWQRPRKEVNTLMNLLKQYLDKEEKELMDNNIKFITIGDKEQLPHKVQTRLNQVEEVTKNNTGLMVNLALNYGSRAEIVEAARKIAALVKDSNLKLEELDEKLFSNFLYTKNLPDPDLLIRTSGEIRLSNFLLWQISYAEIYVTKKLWPDFRKKDLIMAIRDFQKRERRFGGL